MVYRVSHFIVGLGVYGRQWGETFALSQDYSDDLISGKQYGKTCDSCRAAADD